MTNVNLNCNMNNKVYDLLTESARWALEDMKVDYENFLVEKAYEIATRQNTSDAEISLRDLVEAQNSFLNTETFHSLRKKLYFVRNSMLLAFSYIFLGIILYIINVGIIPYDRGVKSFITDNLWIIVIILGVIFFVLGYTRIITLMRINDRNYKIQSNEEYIVKMWTIIENKSKKLMRLRGIEESKFSSVNNIYDFLIRELNSREYIDGLGELLNARNEIVYSHIIIKKEDAKRLLYISQEIINKLNEMICEYK